jgi:D-arabinose 1-dehydrogenase-like Zn-dependent alcohol dehydrogenase
MDHRVTRPAIIGHEMSGVIESVGAGAQGWAAGDRVTVRPLDDLEWGLRQLEQGGEVMKVLIECA